MSEDIKEILKLLEQAYTNSHCIEREKAKRYYDAINNLEHNWNELKKWLEEEIKSWEEAINEERDYELVNEFASRCNNFEEILNKMHELEEGGNNDC